MTGMPASLAACSTGIDCWLSFGAVTIASMSPRATSAWMIGADTVTSKRSGSCWITVTPRSLAAWFTPRAMVM